MASTKQTIYFAYGSNLSLTQMKQRCPGSKFLGVALLEQWTWGISVRGYANVVKCEEEDHGTSDAEKKLEMDRAAQGSGDEKEEEGEGEKEVVYGLLYSLSSDGKDEARLDKAEGVPFSYEKMSLDVETVSWVGARGIKGKVGSALKVLVYVDPRGIEKGGKPKNEYVGRMNLGIREAVEKGLPVAYVNDILREWIPLE